MTLKVGDNARCYFYTRRSKAYDKFGLPARDGDSGKVVQIHEMKDVTIVVIETSTGNVYSHIQNIVDR